MPHPAKSDAASIVARIQRHASPKTYCIDVLKGLAIISIDDQILLADVFEK